MDFIHSRQNPVVKHLIKLATQHRERSRSRQSLLIGTHLIEAALASAFPLQHVFIRDGERNAEVQSLLDACLAAKIKVTTLSGELFDAVEQMPSHTGMFALFVWPEPVEMNSASAILLENVQDPGNVGSILRTAAASSIQQVWLTKGCAEAWSPKVLRAAMGAHFGLDIVEGITIDDIPSEAVVAVTSLQDSTSLYSSDLRHCVMAFGAEGSGASEALRDRASVRLQIPMSGRVESLNVAASAAICLFERERQLGVIS